MIVSCEFFAKINNLVKRKKLTEKILLLRNIVMHGYYNIETAIAA